MPRKLQGSSKIQELCLIVTGPGRTGIVETCRNLRLLHASEGPYHTLHRPQGPFRSNLAANVRPSLERLPNHYSLDELHSFPHLNTVELTAENCLTLGPRARDQYSSSHSLAEFLPRSVTSLKIVRDIPRTMSEAPLDPCKARWVMRALVMFLKTQTTQVPTNFQVLCLSDLLQDFETGFAHLAAVRSWEVWRQMLRESNLVRQCEDLGIELMTAGHVPCEHGCYGPGSYEARHGPMLLSAPRSNSPLDESGYVGWTVPLS